MQAFEVLADPVRRRILELLAAREVPSGAVAAAVRAEFGVSQPAVSQHLKVLRESGFAVVRAEGTRRLYSLDRAPLAEVSVWVGRVLTGPLPAFSSLDALATEVVRGKRARRNAAPSSRSLPEEKIS
jgi:DNA-binding transcriptional ArsR family regulator